MGLLESHTAFLIGSAIEGMLYGMFLILVGYASRILIWRRRTTRINWVQLTFMFGMLLSSTIHYFFGLHAAVVGFIDHGNDPVVTPAIYLESNAVGYPMDILLGITLMMSDLTLLHRLWLVWDRNFTIIIAPTLFMVSYLTTFAIAVNMTAEGGRNAAVSYATIMRLVSTSFTLAMCYSLSVTGFLSYRIYVHTRQLASAFPGGPNVRQYRSTIMIVVESGAILFLAQVTNLVLFEIQYYTGHDIWELWGLPLTQVYCIVPTLIIARVALGVSTEQRLTTATTESRSAIGSGGLRFASQPTTAFSATTTSIPLQKLDSQHNGSITSFKHDRVQVQEETLVKSDAVGFMSA